MEALAQKNLLIQKSPTQVEYYAVGQWAGSLDELLKQVHRWKFIGKRIAFTNGCFDLIHLGHVDYLAKAADLADILIVGLNTDEGVKRLKGPHRPINDEQQRSMVIASLHVVSAVVLFGEDTPLELIRSICPDVLVKGADYTIETIVGSKDVLASGGKVTTIEFLPGYSTTAIEARIRENR